MNILITELGYLLLMSLPVAAVAFLLFRELKRNRAETKAPFSELRRPAGESNRLRVQELDEWIDPWLSALTMTPILFALILTLQKATWPVVIFSFLLSAIVAAAAYRFLRPLIRKRAAYQLGFHGERFVAEELNQLMADGFRVFHDVPFDKYNMDHILVGPTGVFVVETKTKRKRASHGEKKHKVTFDGQKLVFAKGWNTEWLEQTRRNTNTVSQWLSAATAERVAAQAVLTIPQWLVTRTGKGDVHVLNPKEIRQLVASGPKFVEAQQIERISYLLEEKCKLPIE